MLSTHSQYDWPRVRAMIVDGLGYIALLTGTWSSSDTLDPITILFIIVTNTLNLILYRASSLSAQAAA